MFRARDAWVSLSKRLKFLQSRSFCSKKPNNGSDKPESEVQSYTRAYNQALKDLENPDFMTSAKVWLTTPPKKQKFGIDFHLVQFFFACLPALGVYMLAMYSRSEMRRMDAELVEKEKPEIEIENEKKNKELENSPAIVAVRERLGHLEEAVKEIGVEIKRLASNSTTKDQEDGDAENQPATVEPSKTQVSSESSNSEEKGLRKPKPSELTPGSATKDAFSRNNIAGTPEDSKNK